MATAIETFQSKWGFHPVDRATSKKLRLLNAAYDKALRRAKSWERWDRKAPHNRVQTPRIRNAEGQVIGYGEPTPWNEPTICTVFSNKVTKTVNWHPTKGYFKDGVEYTYVLVNESLGRAIRVAAKQARTPVPTADDVRPLSLTVEEIDNLLDLLS